MFVHDLIRTNINITAEISEDEALNFQNLCKAFADEISQQGISGELSSGPSVSSSRVASVWNLDGDTFTNSTTPSDISPMTHKYLPNIIDINEVRMNTSNEMDQLLLFSPLRIDCMQIIINGLAFLLTTYCSTVSVAPFGSVAYGFSGHRTNFNILISAGKIHLAHILSLI